MEKPDYCLEQQVNYRKQIKQSFLILIIIKVNKDKEIDIVFNKLITYNLFLDQNAMMFIIKINGIKLTRMKNNILSKKRKLKINEDQLNQRIINLNLKLKLNLNLLQLLF